MSAISSVKSLVRANLSHSGKRGYRRNQDALQLVAFQNYHASAPNNRNEENQKQDSNQQKNVNNSLMHINNMTSIPHSLLSLHSTPSFPLHNIQSRFYVTYTKPKQKSGVTLVMGLGAVAATAKAGQYAVQAYNQWKESLPPAEEGDEKTDKTVGEDTTMNSSGNDKTDSDDKKEEKTHAKKDSGKRENMFAKFFNMNVGSKYYEGGFEDKMTRREAALILGVRESSTAKRIKDAHRKLLILNHPDTGGSTFLAGKINEAKELLLKGKLK